MTAWMNQRGASGLRIANFSVSDFRAHPERYASRLADDNFIDYVQQRAGEVDRATVAAQERRAPAARTERAPAARTERAPAARTERAPAPAAADRPRVLQPGESARANARTQTEPEEASVAERPAEQAPPPSPLAAALETARTNPELAGQQFVDALVEQMERDGVSLSDQQQAISDLKGNSEVMGSLGRYLNSNRDALSSMTEIDAIGLIKHHPTLSVASVNLLSVAQPEMMMALLTDSITSNESIPPEIKSAMTEILSDPANQQAILANLRDPAKAANYVENLSTMTGMTGESSLSAESITGIAASLRQDQATWIRILGEDNFIAMSGYGNAQNLLGPELAGRIQREMYSMGGLLGSDTMASLQNIPFIGDLLSGLGDIDFAGMAQQFMGMATDLFERMQGAMGITSEVNTLLGNAEGMGLMDRAGRVFGTFQTAMNFPGSLDPQYASNVPTRISAEDGSVVPQAPRVDGQGNRRVPQPGDVQQTDIAPSVVAADHPNNLANAPKDPAPILSGSS